VLSPRDRQLIDAWNRTERTYPLHLPLPQLIEQQVERTPDLVAVSFGAASLTYAELNRKANQLAHHLVALGVGPDVMVGICIDRSIEMVVGLLGTLKAGGAYVPFDPEYPQDRLAFMAADSAVPVLLTSSALEGKAHAAGARTIALDADWPTIAKNPTGNLARPIAPKNLAYTIYTSGSTGKPKGAMNTHEGIVNRLLWMQEAYRLTPDDRVLQKTPFSFDVSVWEFFWPLTTGARLVMAAPGGHKDPAYLVRTIVEEGITTLHFVPSMLSLFNGAEGLERITSVRQVFCSGEALPLEQVKRFFKRIDAKLHNLYGPTEAAVDVTFWECRKDAPGNVVPIGHPIANIVIRILNEALEPVPIGEAGELHIGGVGLARGYLNRPELTREKFIADPFGKPGERLYKTGDLARYLPDGAIEYLGRIDFQVKIRGLRIELGEIEAALLKHPAIKEAVVIASDDALADKRLLAYLVSTGGGERRPTTNQLREALLRELPDYMVPAAFVFIPKMPLSPNGKVDRKGFAKGPLPRPDLEQVYIAPKRPLEKTLCALWCELLELEQVGVRDNFFDLGGNSLLALETVHALAEREGVTLPLVKIFQYPSVAAIADFLEEKEPSGGANLDRLVERVSRQRAGAAGGASRDVAIIGMSGRFPGAYDVDELWANLCQGKETVTFFTKDQLGPGLDPEITENPNYVFARGIIPDGDKFDAEFFGINPAEAKIVDPQQRVFLELAWTALENAGYAPESYPDMIGVYAGMGNNYYYALNSATHPDLLRMVGPFPVMVGNEKDHIATRVAHKLNLTGPAVSVHTACSTALTAIDNAYFSLITHQCDLALAGGISLQTPQYSGQLAEEGGVFAKDGHCRPFDAAADGTMFSDSAGIVVMKRLDEAIRDRDTIYAIIKSTALNNDGSDKVSYLAPSVNGQKKVVALALARAGVSADTIGYIEAHGTATPIGDPIEVEALTQVFRRDTQRKQFCGIGSIKSNLGHPTIAAGVTGVIKAALALKHEQIPPTIHYEKPNPKIDFESSPFYVVSKLTPWPRSEHARRAGVSSFGFGGTNGHAILEEPPPERIPAPSRARQLVVLSAKSREALDRASKNLATHLERHPDISLADAAFTLQVGRTHLNHRRFVVGSSPQDAAALLRAPNRDACGARLVERSAPEVVFLFPGQGSQSVNMGLSFYRSEPAFKAAIDRCAEILAPILGCDLREVLYPAVADAAAAERLKNTRYQQPAVFAVEYALSQLWASWGLVPDAMIGHSIGEFVAATLASVFTLEDALALVAARGRMMSELPGGAMLAVKLPAEEMTKRLPPGVSLAASNAPSMCVVAGEHEAVAIVRAALENDDVFCRLLETSHAFHSEMMQPIVEPFAALVAARKRAPAKLPILSTLTTQWIKPGDMGEPSYWAQHLRSPVRFSEAIHKVLEDPDRVLLEVGPGSQTSSLARQQVSDARTAPPIATLGKSSDAEPEWTGILRAVGELWLAGVPIEWPRFWTGEERGRIALPTYSFARTRHWVDPATDYVRTVATQTSAGAVEAAGPPVAKNGAGHAHAAALSPRDALLQQLSTILEGISGTELGDGFDRSKTFAEMGLDSLFLTQIAYMVKKEHKVQVSFRQLTEEANSLVKLADFVEHHAPALTRSAVVPAVAPAPAPTPANDTDAAPDAFPTNDFQQDILALVASEGAQASCAFNESISIALRGPKLDRGAMQRALVALTARHDALRCVFDRDGRTGRVRAAITVAVPFVDLSRNPDPARALAERLKGDFGQPFDLHAGPLVRFGLFALGPHDHVVAITAHLSVCDMWSLDVLVRDLGALYTAEVTGVPHALGAPDSYRSYALAQRAFTGTDAYRAMGAYWKERLREPVLPLDLPLAKGRPARRTFHGGRLDVRIEPDTVRSLTSLGKETGSSLYTVLLAGLDLCLSSQGGRDRIALGMPTAGQAMAQQNHLVGNCLRYLPLVAKIDAALGVDAFLKTLRNDVVGAMENGRYELGDLLRSMPKPADPSRVPLPAVCLNMSPKMEDRDLRFEGLAVHYEVNPRHFESFEMFINAVLDKNDHLEMQFQFNADLFGEAEIRTLQAELAAVYTKLGTHARGALGSYVHAREARRPEARPGSGLGPGDHPAFFGPSESLYGVCQIPKKRSSQAGMGVLFCYPIAQEYMRSFWAFKLLSNQLLARGVPVFKFDYAGTGDSMGDGADWDIDAWAANVVLASEELRRKADVRDVSVVALRFGAVPLALALERGLAARDVVLWDPVVSGASYLAGLRRIHTGQIAEQTEVFPYPSERDLELDPDEIAGFVFKPGLQAKIAGSSLLERSFGACRRVSLCVSDERPDYRALEKALRGRGKAVDYRVVDDNGHWDDARYWEVGLLPSRVLEAITDALIGAER
jgi:amino acid adenylation domain-containing protein